MFISEILFLLLAIDGKLVNATGLHFCDQNSGYLICVLGLPVLSRYSHR